MTPGKDMQNRVNTLLKTIADRLDLSHPDLDETLRDDVIELLCSEVFLRQENTDPATLPPDQWQELVESAVAEIESFGAVELRPAGENRMACEGFDLVYLLNTDEGVGPDLYRRLSLTYTQSDIDGLPMYEFAEIDEEHPYLLTWPEGEEDFLMDTLLAIEPLPREAFEALAEETPADMCDGACECCAQECAGKE